MQTQTSSAQSAATITTYDPAEALQGTEGPFLVRRPGDSPAIVRTKHGHSIVSWKAAGPNEPNTLPSGFNPPYTILPLEPFLQDAGQSQQGSQQHQSQQGRGQGQN